MADNSLEDGRLDSWKDIAAYVGRDVRTVIRWEKQKGLPVHRIPGGQRKTVFAYTKEIDYWRRYGQMPIGFDVAAEPTDGLSRSVSNGAAALSQKHSIPLLMWVGAFLLFVVAAAFAFHSFTRPRPIQITTISQITNDGLQKEGLVTDGANLYFSEFSNGRMRLKKMPIQGGSIEPIDTPIPNVQPIDISAAGSRLLVFDITGPETEHPLWIVASKERSAHRVGGILCHAAAWSPDGQWIAYAFGNAIYLTTNAGSNSRLIATLAGIPTRLHWTNDGARLLFTLENSATGSRSPWEIALDSQNTMRTLSPLTLPLKDCCESWSHETPQNISFATSELRASQLWAIVDHNRWGKRGADALPLKVQLGDEMEIAIAPHRDEFFVRSIDSLHASLLRFDPTDHAFTRYLPGVSATFVDFSRDGQWIAYERTIDNTLWVSRADGTQVRQIKFPMDNVELPRWSPDGKRIAFMARQASEPWRIFIASTSGTHIEEASVGDDNQGAPTWSPDGHSILYANVACETTRSCAIRRINLITRAEDVLPGSEGMRTARWSPDGRYVAALKQRVHQLYIYSFAIQQWKKLADNATGDDLSWSPDSRYVYMSRPTGNKPAIVRVPISGGEEEFIMDLRPWDGVAGNNATAWFSLAPDGTILIEHADNQPEIFALTWSD